MENRDHQSWATDNEIIFAFHIHSRNYLVYGRNTILETLNYLTDTFIINLDFLESILSDFFLQRNVLDTTLRNKENFY